MAGGWRLWCFDEDGAKVVVVIEWLLWEVYMVVVSWMKMRVVVGSGGSKQRPSPESGRKNGSDAGILWRERELNSTSMTEEGGDSNDIRSTYDEIDEEDEVFRSDYTDIDRITDVTS
ncbi:hypothetical protein Tco_1205435 [Tanacetum coccineum]